MDTARALVAFALIPAAMLAHVLVAQHFGWFQRWPIPELVVMAAAVIVLLRQWIRIRPIKKWRIGLNIAAWILVGFFLWWIQVYSAYPEVDPSLAVGDDLTDRLSIDGLVDSNDEPIDIRSVLDRSDVTLLVFYRGYW